MPASFFERYQAGDRVAVWEELNSLGAAVRHKLYFPDASAVAAETMRRARRNVETIVQRLRGVGYRFLTQEQSEALQDEGLKRARHTVSQVAAGLPAHDPKRCDFPALLRTPERRRLVLESAWQSREAAARQIAESFDDEPPPHVPPPKSTAGDLKRLEKLADGPVPIALRAWYEEVGGVSLLGWHSALFPNSDEPMGLSGCASDPLVVYPLGEMLGYLEEQGEGGRIEFILSPDDLAKSHTSGGGPYTIAIPDPCADPPFNDGNRRTFVNYLRHVFRWGGFPGWAGDGEPPRAEIAALTEGLMEI
jgi:hypothetical protein